MNAITASCVGLAGAGMAGQLAGVLPAPMGPLVALAGGAALGVAVTLGCVRPGLQWFGPAVSSAESPHVCLTFDDGPHPASTPALLDALRDAGMRATFFVLVDRAQQWPELTRRIAQEQELALHGLTHTAHLTFAKPSAGTRELRDAAGQLTQLTGAPIRWYRPPFGVTSPRLARAVEGTDLQTIWCTVRTRDGTNPDPDNLHSACARARAGDILLLHEGPDRPAPTELPRVLAELAARGLRSVTVGELLETA